MTDRPTGWIPDREDRQRIANFCARHQSAAQAFRNVEIPENLTHDWLRVEDQQRIGSCQGHDLTTGAEVLHFYKTGQVIHLSRLHAYLGTQQVDERNGVSQVYVGADTGSTIAGGLEYGLLGFVNEEHCPYRGDKYPHQEECRRILSIPQEAQYRLRSGFAVTDYQHALQCVAGGMVLTIGTVWPFACDADWVARTWSPRGRGGHARAICEIRNRRLCEINSHGQDWGQQGRFCWEESAFNAALKHPWTVCLALTGEARPQPRRIDFTKLWSR